MAWSGACTDQMGTEFDACGIGDVYSCGVLAAACCCSMETSGYRLELSLWNHGTCSSMLVEVLVADVYKRICQQHCLMLRCRARPECETPCPSWKLVYQQELVLLLCTQSLGTTPVLQCCSVCSVCTSCLLAY